jgi:hypothetical protein
MASLGTAPALELERQCAENARLIALLESHGIDWRLPTEHKPVPAPVLEPPGSAPRKRSRCSVACSGGAPPSTRFAGKIGQRASLAIPLFVLMTGVPASATSRLSNPRIAAIANGRRYQIR